MREVSVCSLEQRGFAATRLLIGNSSSLTGFSQCTRNVLDQVPAWWNNGFSPRASAQLRSPKRRYFPGRHFDRIREEALEFAGECPLFSSGQKLFERKKIYLEQELHLWTCTGLLFPWQMDSRAAKGLQCRSMSENTKRFTCCLWPQVVDRAFKYTFGIGASLSNNISCSIRQWDPGAFA
jgi:hypothetical protein